MSFHKPTCTSFSGLKQDCRRMSPGHSTFRLSRLRVASIITPFPPSILGFSRSVSSGIYLGLTSVFTSLLEIGFVGFTLIGNSCLLIIARSFSRVFVIITLFLCSVFLALTV